VLEVGRLRRERRSGGKTDALDAIRAARSVLAQERPATPRAGGERQALQALVAAGEGAVNARCAALGQLRDLLVATPEPLRSELRPLTPARLLKRLAATRPDYRCDPELRGTLLALRSIARRVLQLIAEERELAREIETITRKLAPQLLDQPGVGPHSAAQLVLSWSHQGRITSEAAFARLAGVAPIPASSGQTVRYRLDRSGDRNSTAHCTRSSSPANAHTPPRSPTSNGASKRARPDAKQPAASSATSPGVCTGSSNGEHRWRLDKHRSIARAREASRRRDPEPLDGRTLLVDACACPLRRVLWCLGLGVVFAAPSATTRALAEGSPLSDAIVGPEASEMSAWTDLRVVVGNSAEVPVQARVTIALSLGGRNAGGRSDWEPLHWIVAHRRVRRFAARFQ
jgi:hypothetical protein